MKSRDILARAHLARKQFDEILTTLQDGGLLTVETETTTSGRTVLYYRAR